MTLTEDLEQLVTVIEHQGWPIQQHLYPGLDKDDVDSQLSHLNLYIPPSLYELYQWRNGTLQETVQEGDVFLFIDHFFLSLEVAIDEYHQFIPYYQTGNSRMDFTPCFPFAGFEGSYYAIYCDPKPFRGFFYPIIHIFEGVYIAFLSLETMVQTTTEWYRSGVCDMNETYDEQLKERIWLQLNPGLDLELL